VLEDMKKFQCRLIKDKEKCILKALKQEVIKYDETTS